MPASTALRSAYVVIKLFSIIHLWKASWAVFLTGKFVSSFKPTKWNYCTQIIRIILLDRGASPKRLTLCRPELTWMPPVEE